MITVRLPSALKIATGVQDMKMKNYGSVGGQLKALAKEFPEIGAEIMDETGQPELHILLAVNDQPVLDLDGLETLLNNGDELSIYLALSGG